MNRRALWPGAGAFLIVLAVTALLVPQPATAQSVGARGAVAVGAEGGGEALHLYYGGELGATYGRAGLLGVGFLGSGNEFSSRLLAITPTLRAWARGGADVFVTAGYGGYRETLDAGPTRSTSVFTGGLSGRIPAGPLRVAVILVGFRGSLGPGESGGKALSVSGIRFAVGVGR